MRLDRRCRAEIVPKPFDAALLGFFLEDFDIDRRDAPFLLPLSDGVDAGKRSTTGTRGSGRLEDFENGFFAAELSENWEHDHRIQKLSLLSIQKRSYFPGAESICCKNMNGKDKMALDAKDISGRIKLRMRERGISTEALAEKLGLSEPGVKKLLGGGSTVQYLKLRRLADVLDTTPNYLLHIEDDWSSSAKRSRAILEEATAAALQALGKLEPQTALALAKAILSIPDKPAIVSANLDEKTAARARAEIAVQEYLPPKN